MAELKLDPFLLDRLVAVRVVGARLIETKDYDPDQPRADNGQWGSGGGGSRAAAGGQGAADSADDEDDDAEEYGPGEGYEPADQARHDAASTEMIGSVSRLQNAMDRGSTVFQDPGSTAAQLMSAAEEISKHFDAAASTLDRVNEVRDKYGDPQQEASVLSDNFDLREAIDSFKGGLDTLRSETSQRAREVTQLAAELARERDPVDALQRELEAALGRGSKAHLALSGLTQAVAAFSGAVPRRSDQR